MIMQIKIEARDHTIELFKEAKTNPIHPIKSAAKMEGVTFEIILRGDMPTTMYIIIKLTNTSSSLTIALQI